MEEMADGSGQKHERAPMRCSCDGLLTRQTSRHKSQIRWHMAHLQSGGGSTLFCGDTLEMLFEGSNRHGRMRLRVLWRP